MLRREEVEDALRTVPELRSRAAGASAAVRAASVAIAVGAPIPLVADDDELPEFHARGVCAEDHAHYVGYALAFRLRGLSLGRTWSAIEVIGAPLAALAGFTRDGEPGSPAALRERSHPRTALMLFAAAGATDLLQSSWDSFLSPEDNDLDDDTLQEAVCAAAACGRASTVKWLVERGATFNDTVIAAALKDAHTGVVDDAFEEELRKAPSFSEDVLARWADLVTSAIGVNPSLLSSTREDRRLEVSTDTGVLHRHGCARIAAMHWFAQSRVCSRGCARGWQFVQT